MRIALTTRGPDWASEIEPALDRAPFVVVFDTESERCEAHDRVGDSSRGRNSPEDIVNTITQLTVSMVITGEVMAETKRLFAERNIQLQVRETGTVGDCLQRYTARPWQRRQASDEMFFWT